MAWIHATVATALILAGALQLAYGFSTMGTIAAMWTSTNRSIPGSLSLCALQATDLRVKCLGMIHDNGGLPPPTSTRFLALSAGGAFVCGLEYGSHFLVCWGQVEHLSSNVSYTMVASGGFHVCAIRSDDSKVDCWGEISTPPKTAFTSIISGWGFSCGLVHAGNVLCWGTEGIIEHPSSEIYQSIFAGANVVCGVSLTSHVSCWRVTGPAQQSPPADLQFLSIAGGLYHTCGIRADTHQVLCWGSNEKRQLDLAPLSIPFSQITAGDYYTCGLRLDHPGELFCWGNEVSQIDVVEKNFSNISQAPCVRQCGRSQYQVGQLCPAASEKACLECSLCVNNVEATPCGPYADRTCGTHVEPGSLLKKRNISSDVSVTVVLVAASVFLLGVILLLAGWIYLRYRKKTVHIKQKLATTSSRKLSAGRVIAMSPQELEVATDNYKEEMILGKGAFGTVYKGMLPSGLAVAVKRNTIANNRSDELFEKELELLSRTHHSCLVNLIGYCIEEKLLVFEFMSRGSLYDNIFRDSGPVSGLGWICRIKLAAQAARGLEYLHRYASPSIIHRDVKTHNILLDDDWNAHVSDFGVSLFGPLGSATHLSNMTIVGTPGYVDPEYALSMKLTTKSDVYSFGVVLLELLSGQRAVDLSRPVQNIVLWIKEVMKVGGPCEVLDPSVALPDDPEPLHQALQLSLECTNMQAAARPSMTQVAKCLDCTLDLLVSKCSEFESVAEDIRPDLEQAV